MEQEQIINIGDKVEFESNGFTYTDTVSEIYFLDDYDNEFHIASARLGATKNRRPDIQACINIGYDKSRIIIEGNKYALTWEQITKV